MVRTFAKLDLIGLGLVAAYVVMWILLLTGYLPLFWEWVVR